MFNSSFDSKKEIKVKLYLKWDCEIILLFELVFKVNIFSLIVLYFEQILLKIIFYLNLN